MDKDILAKFQNAVTYEITRIVKETENPEPDRFWLAFHRGRSDALAQAAVIFGIQDDIDWTL